MERRSMGRAATIAAVGLSLLLAACQSEQPTPGQQSPQQRQSTTGGSTAPGGSMGGGSMGGSGSGSMSSPGSRY